MGETVGRADHFAVLGLPRRAALSPDEVRAAFQRHGKRGHPDAGGDAGAFEALNRAHAELADPALRLRHLGELEFGEAPEASGQVDTLTMSLFETVGDALAAADAFLRKRGAVSSAIAGALLAAEGTEVQRAVMAAGGKLRARREQVLAGLEGIDRDLAEHRESARGAIAERYRELRFLGKWEGQIGERMAALVSSL